MPEELNLSNLKPASPRRDRKRVGRGLGSGKGRYSGRGVKGQKARSGSHKMRPGFEGGQMPVYMRMGKQRGSTSKDAMPIGPFRTQTWSVNVRDLERFDEGTEVTPELLRETGLIRNLRRDVKILGEGELTTRLSVSAHAFSKSAVEKIERAGGSVLRLREAAPERKCRRRGPEGSSPVAETAPEAGGEEVSPETSESTEGPSA